MNATVAAYFERIVSEDPANTDLRRFCAIHRGTADPLLVTFYEEYRDDAAVKAHHDSPYLQEFMKRLGECGEDGAMRGFFEEIIAKK